MSQADPFQDLVALARDGDEQALEDLVRGVQDKIYGLAVRILADVEDARDATQEILIKVVTNLATFRGDAAFTTWVYRVASNHLVSAKRRQREQFISFDALGEIIDSSLAPPPEGLPDRSLVVEQMRLACTQSMLLCLDRTHRLAFILGEVLELDGVEAAAILEVEPATFRKRLSRARQRLGAFMRRRCGVYDAANPCRCPLQITNAVKTGFIDPDRLDRATHPVRSQRGGLPRAPAAREVDEVSDLLSVAKVFRTHPDYAAPRDFAAEIQRIVTASDRGGGSDAALH